MKAIKYIFQGGLYLLLGLLSVSCEKTTYPEYDTAFSGIYFEEDSIRYSFGVTPLSTSSYIMELPVKIMGTPTKQRRTFQVEVIANKTTAEVNVHYKMPAECVIEADSVKGILPLEVLRNDLGDTDSYQVTFKLKKTETFTPVSEAAKLQAFLTKALLCGMLLAMGVSLFTGSPDNAMPVFSQVTGAGGGKAATEGASLFAGIVSVLVLTPFFYAGFDTIPQQAEEAAEGLNWNKFGKIISLALLAAGGFYMVCIYSFGTILDWHEFVKSPVPALACLKGINMLLYLAMLVIATLGPMGPMNSFYGATSRIMLAMGRKGQLPEQFAEVDPKSGAPKLACVVLGVITVVGPFLGKNMLIPLTNVSALAFIFSCGMVALACLRMRFTEPDLPRPYEVPGGKFGICLAIAACAVIIGLLVIPFSPASLNMVEWSIVIGWLAIGLALMAFTNSRKK